MNWIKLKEDLTAQSKKYKKQLKRYWIVYGVGVVLAILFFISLDLGLWGFMPSVEELANHQNSLATEVYSEDGEVLGKYYFRNRVFVDYEELPSHLVEALIATEDERYYEHSGIDIIGLGRALSGRGGGGSTISQQLAKNLFPRDRKLSKVQIVFRKFKEWVIAVKLERNYTKEEIIAMYFNTYDFLNQAVGIKSAAKIYYNTSPEHLNLNQSATLVGMAKNSSLFNPKRRRAQTALRRNVVLHQMLKKGYINRATFDLVKTQPLVINFQEEDHKQGKGTYLREYIRSVLSAEKPEKANYPGWAQQQYKEDSIQWETNPAFGWCQKNVKTNGKNYDIYTDGLKIHTTINSKMQGYAEEAVQEHLTELQSVFDERERNSKGLKNSPFSNSMTKDQIDKIMETAMKNTERYQSMKKDGAKESAIEKAFHTPEEMSVFTWQGLRDTTLTPYDSILYYKGFLRAGFMAMEPGSGHVKAYVGGGNYEYFMYDMVTKGKRQVGSTFKPFLYAVAMQEGLTPCHKTLNVPVTFTLPSGQTWKPKNSSNSRVGEEVTLKWGLAQSVNYITAWIMKQFGPAAVVQIARRMGIVSPLDEVPSLALGISDISVKEMVGAYGTFANKGVYVEPLFISHIEDKNGNELARFKSTGSEVLSEETAYTMTSLLKGVVNGGTGQRLRNRYKVTAPWGGKTGTTQNNSDGWFMSISPHLVTGTWAGAEDRGVRFRSTYYGQGANMALPVFAIFINKVYADKSLKFPQEDFVRPPGYSGSFNCNQSEDSESSEDPDTIEL